MPAANSKTIDEYLVRRSAKGKLSKTSQHKSK